MDMHEEILSRMEKILNQLIVTAEKLKDLSQHVTSEDELRPLQEKQEDLIAKLLETDEEFNKALKGKTKYYQSSSRTRIGEKLDYFQKLNTNFLENLGSSRGLIQFEIHRIKEMMND